MDVSAGGHGGFRLVGLGSGAARGMEHRLRAALRNRGLPLPEGTVTVNFAPASLAKEGPPLDLPLAAALLGAAEVVPRDRLSGCVLHGELGLDGTVRPVPGALAAAEAALRRRSRRFACAEAVAGEAAAVESLQVHGLSGLDELPALLRGEREPVPSPAWPPERSRTGGHPGPDLADVRGQLHGRRALEIAAAGAHGLLLVGPPGAGKSLLARRLPGLLPPPSRAEALEITRVHSAAGLTLASGRGGLASRRPFRAPHHGLSAPALVGGGRPIAPGELSLAHRGVLFLDELPEFRREALEALRQPLEEGRLTVARSGFRAELPARVLFVAAMNPCPCGWLGSGRRPCACSDGQVRRYRGRVSGPLLDRLDLHVELPALAYDELAGTAPGESSAVVAARVLAARRRQQERQGLPNAALSGPRVRELVSLVPAARALLRHAIDKLGFSARAHDRVLRLALTIRDLAAAESGGADPSVEPGAGERLDEAAVAEALSYRFSDRPSRWRAELSP